MSSHSASAVSDPASNQTSHRSLLANLDHDPATSSDSEDIETPQEELQGDSQSFIGVSIGREQDRLRAPQTPAADKLAALDGQDPFDAALRDLGYGDPSTESSLGNENVGRSTHQNVAFQTQNEQQSAVDQHDTAHRHESKPFFGSDGAMASILRGEQHRPRSHSGPSAPRKLLSFNLPSLPSMPKLSSSNRFSIDSAMQWVRGDDRKQASQERIDSDDVRVGRVEHTQRDSTRDSSQFQPTRKSISRPPILRHSTSDGSLALYHTMSRASSLGDDSRWEDIHEQVNSRMKALRDSWADSNLRLPKFKNRWADAFRSDVTESSADRDDAGHNGLSVSTRDLPRSRSMDPLVSPPGGMPKKAVKSHPNFAKALKGLTGDVVILGGYRGSILRSSEPPNRQLWVPIKVGLNIRKVNLEVGLEYDDELKMEDTIFASGMLQNIGPVDISKRLFKRLRACKNAEQGKLRVWDYGYDWRLSPKLLSKQFESFLERLPGNKHDVPEAERGVTVIAHSLGGLITRHVVNRRPELFSGVVYAGVPYNCINILGPLRNGDEVLLSSKVLTAQVNFSIRTSFALLPLNGQCFLDEDTKEQYPVDFFDPKTWEEYRLTPCIARPLPPLRKAESSQSLVGSLMESVTNALPSVNPRKLAVAKKLSISDPGRGRTVDNKTSEQAESSIKESPHQHELSPPQDALNTNMGTLRNPQMDDQDEETTVSTAVTIPKDQAMAYLTRTLAETKQFKLELEYKPDLEHLYPPAAVIYGKSTPTVYGAKVRGREGIKHADAYDNLQFASGDGVVLARAAQIPDGYRVAKGGVVSSDRGHVTLLGDLEAVGRCLNAILLEKRRRAKGERGEAPPNAPDDAQI